MSLLEDRDLAMRLADLADDISGARFRTSDIHVSTKPDGSLVTDVDRDIERELVTEIRRYRPVDGIVGEELGPRHSSAPRYWLIDPIDGTASFLEGSVGWGTLVALVKEGEVVLGVASSPALEKRWWSVRGQGSFLVHHGSDSSERLHVSKCSELSEARAAFGGAAASSGSRGVRQDRGQKVVERLRSVCRAVVKSGPSALQVSEGEADLAVLLVGPNGPWNLAAFVAIVEEAGGRFSDFTGGRDLRRGDALFSNGELHEEALATLSFGEG